MSFICVNCAHITYDDADLARWSETMDRAVIASQESRVGCPICREPVEETTPLLIAKATRDLLNGLHLHKTAADQQVALITLKELAQLMVEEQQDVEWERQKEEA
jgi:hypothetical protein